MKKKGLIWILVLLACLSMAFSVYAANIFVFTERSITLFEGQTVKTKLNRDGTYKDDGEITYTSSRTTIATVSEDGKITGVSKGDTVVTAVLTRDGRRIGATQTRVKVLRPVTKVTLNTTKLSVYDPEDPAVFDLLEEETEYQVLVLPAGKSVTLSATCTPETASNRRITFSSSDDGVAKVTGSTLRAIQRGECDLTIASVLNPKVTETFRLLVIDPIKKIQIDAGNKKVAAGAKLKLKATCTPKEATIKKVVWSSSNTSIATVNSKGVVTGKKRGGVNIIATAADGSQVKASVYLTVTQPVTSLSLNQDSFTVVNGRSVQARASVQPMNASDRTVSWSSSDETIATVRGGQITGRKAGTCTITCKSNSNPDIKATAEVSVVQLATKVECTTSQSKLSLRTGETLELSWKVLPEDATNKDLTYKSLHPKIVTVDEDGVVTAVSRGTATIVATSKDQGKRQGSVRITVIQPATGVEMQKALYYIQRGSSGSIRAIVQPRNANNQKILWSSVDETIATVRSNGTSTGSVYGVSNGTTTVTAYTEDGGFTATTEIRVGNFNEAVMVEELYVNDKNQIKISLRNMSQDITLGNVHFIVECYDIAGNPMICNTDGEKTYFEGDYSYLLYPLERTAHNSFRFKDYVIDRRLGAVVLTVVSWRDADGYTWKIPESERIRSQWTSINFNPK